MARKQGKLLRIVDMITLGMCAVGLIGGGVYLLVIKGDSFSKLPALPVDSYLKGANLWSHDAYKIEGRVDNVIFRALQKDEVVASIQPTGTKVRLPVVIQMGEGMKPVQLEQELVLKVTVGDAQTLLCKEYASLKKQGGFRL